MDGDLVSVGIAYDATSAGRHNAPLIYCAIKIRCCIVFGGSDTDIGVACDGGGGCEDRHGEGGGKIASVFAAIGKKADSALWLVLPNNGNAVATLSVDDIATGDCPFIAVANGRREIGGGIVGTKRADALDVGGCSFFHYDDHSGSIAQFGGAFAASVRRGIAIKWLWKRCLL